MIIDPAIQRRTALKRLQKALHDGSSPHQIMNAFNTCMSVTGRFPPISQVEAELIAHARHFVEASDADDEDQMVVAYDYVKQSPYKDIVTFSEKERERVDSARMMMQTIVVARQTIVATFITTQQTLNISLDLLKRVCSIKELSFRVRINELQQSQAQAIADTDDKQRIEALRQQWEAELDPHYLAFYALEDLLNDALIREKGALEGNDLYEQQQQALLDNFKRMAVSDYKLWLRSNRWSDDDVVQVLRLLLRRELLALWLQEQQKSGAMNRLFSYWGGQKDVVEQWMKKARKDANARVIYSQHQSNPEQRAVWLANLVQKGP